jgi:hypothetical protein
VTLHTAKPAIFGFQLAIACGVTKRPVWFCGLTHGDRISTLARPSAEKEVTLAPSPTKETPRDSSFTQKALIFTIGGYAAHWFARSASQNPFTLITISSALWWVFGGYRVLGQPKQKFDLTKKSCTNPKIDAQLDSSSVVVADTPCVTPLVDPVGTVIFQDPEVQTWLDDIDTDSDGGIALPQGGKDVYGSVEIEEVDLEEPGGIALPQDGNDIHGRFEAKGVIPKIHTEKPAATKVDTTIRESGSPATEHIEAVFRDIYRLSKLLSDENEIEQVEISKYMVKLFTTSVDVASAHDNNDENFLDDGEDVDGDVFTGVRKSYGVAIKEGVNVEAVGLEEHNVNLITYPTVERLAAIVEEHDNPTFSDGDIFAYAREQAYEKNVEPVIITNHEETYELDPFPGRPISADAADIDYMLSKLDKRLPDWLNEALANQSMEVRNKTRGPYGSNAVRDALDLFCYKSFVDPMINNVADIATLIGMCRKRATPDCSVDMRHHMGPNDLRRAYLTDEETVAMDEGCTDWFQLYNHEPEICEFQKVTRMAEQFNPLEFGTNAVIFPWIDDVDENHLLDPFAYGDCACGSAAIYEAEPIYNPAVQNLFLKFPLLIGGPDGRYTSTVDVDGRIPRCQHITQAYEQHKTETDSIYILVDTSFEDINDRLSDTDGYLPGPHTTRSRYPSRSPDGVQDAPASM